MIDEREIVRRAVESLTQTPPEPGFERFLRRRDRKDRSQRMRAAAVGIAVVVGLLWVAVTRPGVSPEEPPVGTEPTLTPDPHGSIPGLPDEGPSRRPSTPPQGTLVLSLEGGIGHGWTSVWIYEDGRMIWEQGYARAEPSTGLLEQRLTPEWVELLRSRIVATGLFQADLGLARGPDETTLSIRVRNGDRLIRVTWAPRVNFRIGPAAPAATRKQAEILVRLYSTIVETDAWPATARGTTDLGGDGVADSVIRQFVPTSYAICPRGVPKGIDGARALSLLPPSAQELLGQPGTDPFDVPGDCVELLTEDARDLAQILDRAGIDRNGRDSQSDEETWLRYLIPDPSDPENQVWLSFWPILPHGEAIFLGPG